MANRSVPYGAFSYVVTFDGGEIFGGFSDVSGIGAVGGVQKVSDVTLKRGVVKSDDLWQWIEDVRRTGVAAKRTVVIRLRDETGQDVQAWTLNGAFPLKYTGPTLAAKGGGDVAMEELVLSAEGLEFAQLG